MDKDNRIKAEIAEEELSSISMDNVLSILLCGDVLDSLSIDCEFYHDQYILDTRLPHTYIVTDKLLRSLSIISERRTDNRGSACRCGKAAYDYLVTLLDIIVEQLDLKDLKKLEQTCHDLIEWITETGMESNK